MIKLINPKYRLPIALSVVFIIFTFWNFSLFKRSFTIEYPDSFDYHLVSEAPIYSKNFWAGNRTPITPLVFKIFHKEGATFIDSYSNIPYVYMILSTISWGLLVYALTKTIQSN